MDDITPDLLLEGVGPALMFREYRVFDEIGSTNAYLKALPSDEPPGVVAVADYQTMGRGREGRSWVAPPGAAIQCSVLLRPPLPPDRIYLLTTACALAVRSAIAPFVREEPRLKWPNDVMLGGRKVCGVLTETEIMPSGRARAVVGFGVNVREAPPARVAPDAGCVRQFAIRPVTRLEVLVRALREYDRLLVRLYAGDLEGVWRAWRSSLETLRRRVVVRGYGGGDEVAGWAADVALDGALILETEDGERRRVYAGEAIERA